MRIGIESTFVGCVISVNIVNSVHLVNRIKGGYDAPVGGEVGYYYYYYYFPINSFRR